MMDEMRLSSVPKGLEYPTNVGKPDPLRRREEKVMADQSGVQGMPPPPPPRPEPCYGRRAGVGERWGICQVLGGQML